ncbi:hypothetical protein PICMEDRAFT_13978 [Pichia membranifaciens NRRL Y-2026]|uniref:Vta1 C-terminal domain-containing protein n=1 Tax=Pichia membranifaciens NRRL Y-2026 TaxID=763406 RepID=A0A1E3NQR6_9ASCO|nr:hypothetical protein PICMEDRAFT_13978 [Pichia membranifaciens NRRL Y-2026]ODQ48396.1 hypothetical protein PICMEDRAFT_13978 [Pichia membranifaciens NRRL Y-2026]
MSEPTEPVVPGDQNESVDEVPAAAVKLIGPFIKRGKELLNVQPLISYYCYLYAAQLILESQLHLQDAGVANYIEVLLNTVEGNRKIIESTSSTLADILTDKEKSFKLILGFSLSVLNKASGEIDSHTSSKSTVQSFMAFLNFVEVLKLWPELYQSQAADLHNQIKYAKFHSNRILKAIKSDTDPNDYVTPQDEQELSNFLQPGAETTEKATEDATSAETVSPPTFVEEAPPNSSSINLPEAPSEIKGEINLPSAPVLIKGQKNSLGLPSAPQSSDTESTVDLHVQPKPVSSNRPKLPAKPSSTTRYTQPLAPSPAVVAESKILSKDDVEEIWSKAEVISNAQKKAKFAISALNYEDIETAITELQGALKLLRGE